MAPVRGPGTPKNGVSGQNTAIPCATRRFPHIVWSRVCVKAATNMGLGDEIHANLPAAMLGTRREACSELSREGTY
jgi:hypothetical protein